MNWSTSLRRFLDLTRPRYGVVVLSVALLVFSSLFEGLSISLVIPILDILMKGGDSARAMSLPFLGPILAVLPAFRLRYFFFSLLAMILALTVLKNALVYISELMISAVSRSAEHVLRTRIFSRYLSFGKKFFDRNKIGNLSDLAITQVLQACNFFRDLHNFLFYALLSLVYLAIMFVISWRLTAVALALLPLLFVIVKTISNRIVRSTREKFQIDQAMSAALYDSLANMALIRSYTNEEGEAAAYERISERSRANLFSIWKKILIAPYLQEAVLTAVTVLLVAVCVLVFLKGQVQGLALFLSFFIMMRRFAGNINLVGATYTQLSKAFVPIRQIVWVFEDEDKSFVPGGAKPFEGLKEKIEFRGVSFGYNGQPVLKSLNLVFPKGRITAIVGPTGAGKTTLVNLLPRFYDAAEGKILFDGVPVREFDLRSLRRKIATVDQEVAIFNTSIRRNILYGYGGDVPQARLDDAAKKAFLYDLIMSLPDKYETLVGDRGVRLSGGEKQRVAIARALLKDPDVFIFDEATSSLDVETERQIQHAIENVTAGRTVIAIAHRLSTIKNADHIYVIESGRMVEEGSFRELLDRRGKFHYYWNLHWTEPEEHHAA